ncbi:MAG TPA: PilN domain-containing protein, partial [Sedimentisphaerales bacterium]|nr:PilN domain-containing protein [Sedimentisphaerales bacterium]
APSAPSPVDRYDQVADDINAVLQFYTVEGTTIPSVVVIDDEHDLAPVEAGETIRSKVACEAVEVWTRSTLSDHVAIEPGLSGKGSITALGLAMRFLVDGPKAATVNLLPKEADRATVVQRNLVLTAIGLAALLLAVILGTGAVRWTVMRMQGRIAAMQQAELKRGDQSLADAVAELAATETQIAATTAEMECLTRAVQSHPAVDWVQLLGDVGAAVPKQAQLTELTVDGTSILQVEGVCESNEDVATLVSMLNRSDSIARAELLEARRIQGRDGAIRYAITCTLAPGEIR